MCNTCFRRFDQTKIKHLAKYLALQSDVFAAIIWRMIKTVGWNGIEHTISHSLCKGQLYLCQSSKPFLPSLSFHLPAASSLERKTWVPALNHIGETFYFKRDHLESLVFSFLPSVWHMKDPEFKYSLKH